MTPYLPMTADILRMLERIIIALCGGMSIFLGYRLFISVPFAKTGSGKFEFPKLGKIALSHIGPGVFFALFGAGILVVGLLQSTKYQSRGSFDLLSMFSLPAEKAQRTKILSDLEDLKKVVASRGDPDDVKRVDQIIVSIKGYLARYEFEINREAAGPDTRLPGT